MDWQQTKLKNMHIHYANTDAGIGQSFKAHWYGPFNWLSFCCARAHDPHAGATIYAFGYSGASSGVCGGCGCSLHKTKPVFRSTDTQCVWKACFARREETPRASE